MSRAASDLARQLQELEESLLRPEVRESPDRLEALLADEFTEYGLSGGTWSKADVLAAAGAGTLPNVELPIREFHAEVLSDSVVAVTYRSVTREADGSETHAVRYSMWVRVGGRWKLALHRGTPADVG